MKAGFLLDTNVISEQTRPTPDSKVSHWITAQPNKTLFLSAITTGELRKGIHLLASGKRCASLEQCFESELLTGLSGQILSVTPPIADRWSVLTATRQIAGKPLGPADGLIAATALEHNLVLVTRNTRDFTGLGVQLFNPWEDQPVTPR